MHRHVLIFIEHDSHREQDSQHIFKMILQCWLYDYYCCVCHLYNMVAHFWTKIRNVYLQYCLTNNLPQFNCIKCYRPSKPNLQWDSPWSWVNNHWSLHSIPPDTDHCHACHVKCIHPSLSWVPWFWYLSFVPIKADPQALRVLVNIMIMTIHSCQLCLRAL
jgi:hypothetical protein